MKHIFKSEDFTAHDLLQKTLCFEVLPPDNIIAYKPLII